MRHDGPAVLRPPDGSRPFVVSHFPPSAGLVDAVEHLWSVEWSVPGGRDHEQEVLSHPVVHLTVEGPSIEVYGVATTRFTRRLTGTGRVLGIHFRPGGFSAASRVPLRTLVNRSLPASAVLGPWAGELAPVRTAGSPAEAAALADEVLAAHVPPPSEGARLVSEAVAMVVADPTMSRVSDLASCLGTSVRTLQRRFDQHLGVGPKWVLRRQRIYDALDRLQGGGRVDWSELALELGFTDQPHLGRAFRQLVGVPPAAYERRLMDTRISLDFHRGRLLRRHAHHRRPAPGRVGGGALPAAWHR